MPLPENVRLGDLTRFAAVIEAGGFTAAARILGESTKKVSRRIAALEAEVGLRLLHRTTRSVRPTPEGLVWYQSARNALDVLEQAAGQTRPGDANAGKVRVQVPTLFVDPVIDWVAEIMLTHPGLEVDLIVGDLAEDMLSLGLDIVLTAVPPHNAGVVLRSLGTASPKLRAHADYLARAGVPTRPEHLATHSCLRFHTERAQTHWLLVHDDGTSLEVAVGGRLACNDSRTLLRALTMGMGIGPDPAGRPDLVHVLPGWRMAGIEMFLAIAPGRRRLARVRTIVDGLEAIARRAIERVREP